MVGHIHLLLELLKKRTSRKAVWAQPRRIVCEHCHDAFVYLATGKASAQAEVWRGSNADRQLEAKVREILAKNVAKKTRPVRLGAALCPHCHRYQEWMVRASRFRGVFTSGLLCGIVGATVGGILLARATEKSGEMDWWWLLDGTLLGVGAGAGVALLFGLVLGLKPGAHPDRQDPASLTEGAWEALTEEARTRRKDATRLFWDRLARPGLKKNVALWPMPIRDVAAETTKM